MTKQAAITLIFALALITNSFGQTAKPQSSLNTPVRNAVEYFDQIKERRFNDYLRSVRPEKLSPTLKARALSLLRKEDLVNPSAKGQTKLDALAPILNYHERNSVIELKVLRVPTATTAFLAGAAVLITEPALDILSTEELQAMVAHELGHEYYWSEFELARQQGQDQKLQELELRCDGIAVITLCQLGLNPESLISGVLKLNRYNGHKEGATAAGRYVLLEERVKFIRAMIEMTQAGSKVPLALACK